MANENQETRLKVAVSKNGNEYTFSLNGRLNTFTALDLEEQVEKVLPKAEKLIFDLGSLQYLSSAGLRVLLGAAQEIDVKGGMVIRNLTPGVKMVFDVTGFSNAFTFE